MPPRLFSPPTIETVNTAVVGIGDIVKVEIVLDVADLVKVKGKKTTGTAKQIKGGQTIQRFAMVLAKPDEETVIVAYLSTFNFRTTFPSELDNTFWHPIQPALKENSPHHPVPLDAPLGARLPPQWASLRKSFTIRKSTTIRATDRRGSLETALGIRNAMADSQADEEGEEEHPEQADAILVE